MTLALGVVPKVLFDGIVTQQQLSPGQGQGDGTIAVTAEDIRFAMDRVERSESYPVMPEAVIAALVMARYLQFGLVPVIIPPPIAEVPLPMDRVTTQSGTDLAFLNELATRLDYIFAVTPGPAPSMNIGYFGPVPRLGLPQPALTVNMGADTNVSEINFQMNAADTRSVSGEVQDRQTNQRVPVSSTAPARPPLATSLASRNADTAGEARYRAGGARAAATAMAEAQAMADRSTDVLTVEGQVDGALRLTKCCSGIGIGWPRPGRQSSGGGTTNFSRMNGHILLALSAKFAKDDGNMLAPRTLVGMRGAGLAYDGFYFVEEVTHRLARGSYMQKFKLTREGTGSTTPVVPP